MALPRDGGLRAMRFPVPIAEAETVRSVSAEHVAEADDFRG
jgi:hypothetical protein